MLQDINNKVILTIAIGVYNCEKYIEECIDSAITYVRSGIAEVIITDDGSTDDTSKICDRYSYLDGVTVIHQKNKGQGSTYQNAVNLAKGKYIMFMDADDKLSDQYDDFLSKLCACNEDIIAFNMIRFDENHFWDDMNVLEKYNINAMNFDETYDISSVNVFGRECFIHELVIATDLLRKNDIRTNSIIFSDAVILIKVLAHSRTVRFLDEVIYLYRIQDTQATSLYGQKKWSKQIIDMTLEAIDVFCDLRVDYRTAAIKERLGDTFANAYFCALWSSAPTTNLRRINKAINRKGMNANKTLFVKLISHSPIMLYPFWKCVVALKQL